MKILLDSGNSLTLKELSLRTKLAPPKLHRYLVSLIRLEAVKQELDTKRYDIGPATLAIGVAAFRRLSVTTAATDHLKRLRDALNHTVFLATWTPHGATILHWLESSRPMIVNTKIGSNLPLLHSATGRLFAAFLPPIQYERLLASEWINDPRAMTPERYAAMLAEIRCSRLSRVQGDVLPNVLAFAAPIFDHTETMVGAITIMGSPPTFDVGWDSREARLVTEAAVNSSNALGYRGRWSATPRPSPATLPRDSKMQ